MAESTNVRSITRPLIYHIDKVLSAAAGTKPIEFGVMNLQEILKTLEQLKTVVPDYKDKAGLAGTLQEIEYPLAEFGRYLEGRSHWNSEDATCMAGYLHDRFKELNGMAEEIDRG